MVTPAGIFQTPGPESSNSAFSILLKPLLALPALLHRAACQNQEAAGPSLLALAKNCKKHGSPPCLSSPHCSISHLFLSDRREVRLRLSYLQFFSRYWNEVIVLLREPRAPLFGRPQGQRGRHPDGATLLTFNSLSRISTNPSSSSVAPLVGVREKRWARGLSSSTSIFRSGVRHCVGDEQMQATQGWGPKAVPTSILLRKDSSCLRAQNHPPIPRLPSGVPALHALPALQKSALLRYHQVRR